MIGCLRGNILSKSSSIVLEVNSIGYELQMPMGDMVSLKLGAEYLIYTHLAVREDGYFLYGFLEEVARDLFRELIRVSGVGAKIALTILSVMGTNELLNSILAEDLTNLSRVNGIGTKTAKRLVMELKDRLAKFSIPSSPLETAFSDALSALISLGYNPHAVRKMLEPFKGKGLSSEVLIKKALQGQKYE